VDVVKTKKQLKLLPCDMVVVYILDFLQRKGLALHCSKAHQELVTYLELVKSFLALNRGDQLVIDSIWPVKLGKLTISFRI
jgi:hypothetical protein